MARLTMEEKFRIQQLLAEGKTHKEIGEQLNRRPQAIKRYAGEFTQFANDYLKTNEDVKEEPVQAQEMEYVEELNPRVLLSDDIRKKALRTLKAQNVKEVDAEAAIRKVEKKLTQPVVDSELDLFVALCVRQLDIHNALIREAVGGRDGVMIMTGTASQISEEKSKARQPTVSRSARDSIFRPKNG